MLKISIITVCYNSATTIKDTITSVASQSYSSVEHIIVDGASKDSTINIIRASPSVTSFVSEPDNGIYDAMNKGIGMVTGDIIGTLNADDFYANDSVLSEVARVFEDPEVDACYADLVYVAQNDTNRIVRYWKSRIFSPGLFKRGWMPAHPTFFVRRSVYEKFGLFNLNYKIAADFELLFRLFEQYKIRALYIPHVLVKMRLGGTTNKNFSNILIQNNEIVTILKKHYPNFSVLKFVTEKLYNRLIQFISRPQV